MASFSSQLVRKIKIKCHIIFEVFHFFLACVFRKDKEQNFVVKKEGLKSHIWD